VGRDDNSEVTALTKLREKWTTDGGDETTNVQKVNGSRREETSEETRSEHPVCIGLVQPGDHVHRGPIAAGRNGSSAGIVEVSAIVGGFADRDDPRNTSLKVILKEIEATGTALVPSRYVFSVSDEDGHESTRRRTNRGESLVTIDTGAAVTLARPDIEAGLPEIEPSTKCALQTASGRHSSS
jgi:hypothetical protein